MARKTPVQADAAPPILVKSHDEARKMILARVESGKKLLALPVTSSNSYEEWEREIGSFNDYNRELLRRLFSTDEYSQAYSRAGSPMVISLAQQSFHADVRERAKRLQSKIDFLTTLVEKLDLIDGPAAEVAAPLVTRNAISSPPNKYVFVVHGHDEEAKAIVARFIGKCGLDPIILHEQEDRGRTIIEKFEDHADVGFAVVLLTPDDLGGPKSNSKTPDLRPRARQNVVLELGYFIGRLTRQRVFALKKGDVEIPSDYDGVIYTSLGPDDGWKIRLAKELRAAGYDVDMNKVL